MTNEFAVALPVGPAERNYTVTRRPFWFALGAVTLAPFGLILGLPANGSASLAIGILIVVASAHVAATAAVFRDPEFRPIAARNRVRFFALPALLAAGFLAVALALPPAAWNLVLMGMTAWQLQHYQRQSYGIAAFGCKANGIAMPAGFSRAVDLSVIAGTLGVFANGSGVAFPASLAPATRVLAVLIYLAPVLWLIATFIASPALRRAPIAASSIIAAILFLGPALLPSSQAVVFWSYSIAHGAQYFVFMLALGWAAPQRGPVLLTLLLATVFGVIAFPLMNQSEAWTAIYLGIAAGHFLIDAKVWKLREQPQRSIIGGRFRDVLRRDDDADRLTFVATTPVTTPTTT